MIIDDVWERLSENRKAAGFDLELLRLGYVAGLYAAAASINAERAVARDISEAGFRVEQTG